MKRFKEFINESAGIPSVVFEIEISGKKYYIIANSENTQMQITFTEEGEQVDNFSEEFIKENPDIKATMINHVPPKVLKTLQQMGAIAGYEEPKKPMDEPQPKKKPYIEMGQKELNYQLNIAIENEDWKTAEEIASYIKDK